MAHDEARNDFQLIYTSAFRDEVNELRSAKLVARIWAAGKTLRTFPFIGSQPRDSLRDRFGEDALTFAVSPYLIVYRVQEETVILVALVYGPSVV